MNAATRTTGAAFLAAVLGGPALAQQGDGRTLAEDQVYAFFEETSQVLTDLVQTGDGDGIRRWVDTRVADGAEFWYDLTTIVNDERIASSHGMLDREMLLSMSQLVLDRAREGAMPGYHLAIEVEDVKVIGDGLGAVADTVVRESGDLPASTGGVASAAAEASEQSSGIHFEVDGTCRFVLTPGVDGLPLIELSACRAEVRLH